ncbi:hypothetical protein BJX63DRAFT_147901 [Aspergillus granulosus]|uniref:Uncharacterized protein n=1 Tax=Aspergillus granulosus TaxID=176169 RepID=A0ABR4HKV7_9EURO
MGETRGLAWRVPPARTESPRRNFSETSQSHRLLSHPIDGAVRRSRSTGSHFQEDLTERIPTFPSLCCQCTAANTHRNRAHHILHHPRPQRLFLSLVLTHKSNETLCIKLPALAVLSPAFRLNIAHSRHKLAHNVLICTQIHADHDTARALGS